MSPVRRLMIRSLSVRRASHWQRKAAQSTVRNTWSILLAQQCRAHSQVAKLSGSDQVVRSLDESMPVALPSNLSTREPGKRWDKAESGGDDTQPRRRWGSEYG
ncbi:uncharacterized protein PgNI_07308 [Pyricularia grisea]|uniref:Uncharacterized protein n=1 Tax=Pyricularia grisea TaxID=148305 RepID=A0A6P8B2Q1_PYRGI|nr:uncharacterized protein PgNI_07308 [Pyricularia grisea]TLD09137.1 hypothetical protein PgNI_07308 [Pyricularia grisea]